MLHAQPAIEAELGSGALTPWAERAYLELRDKVADEAFPCTFGTVALRKHEILFAFLESTDPASMVDGLVQTLTEYATFIEILPVVRASMQPLAVLMPPQPEWRSIEDYYHQSWRLLAEVHRRDPAPWPSRIPADPDSPGWSFCFHGTAFFINFKTPHHRRRRSRRMQHSYLWLVQARDGFDIVAGDTVQGRNARRIIRQKLAAYDAIPMYPELGHYGDPANREWKQYFVPEANQPVTAVCPFRSAVAAVQDDPRVERDA